MAVLERKAAPALTVLAPAFASHDTVAIAGLNAIARAHASFQARSKPYIGNAATLLSPHEAYVVHGLVYYIDGLGSVWTMGADGRQAQVARFPIGLNQQEVSFAVSPDGCHLMATVLTAPNPSPPPSGVPFPGLNGTWKLDLMSADVGGAATTIRSWSSTAYPGQPGGIDNVVLAGWDATGPLVVVGSYLGTQAAEAVDNFEFVGGFVTHLDPTTRMPGTAIGGSTCTVVQVSPSGDITCAYIGNDNQSAVVSVISSSGQVEVQPFSAPGQPDVAVGPGGMIAVTGQWRNGSATGTLPSNFQPEGWIDANTIFGRLGTLGNPAGNAALAHLSGGGATIENLGFAGDYVGMLSG